MKVPQIAPDWKVGVFTGKAVVPQMTVHEYVMPDHLYFTDNGCVLCDKHLGASARMTAHDISGQRIQMVHGGDRRAARKMGFVVRCESCGTEGV